MSKINVGILVTSLVASSFLIGCASQSDLESVRELAVNAQNSADNAQNTATNASKCCEANRQSLERMYQKLMTK